MTSFYSIEKNKKKWLKPVLVGAAVLALTALIGLLAVDLVRKLDTLNRATSDNVEWQLSQVEVEYLSLVNDVSNAQAQPPVAGLSDVRQRFDVLYSRIVTLDTGLMFTELRQSTNVGALVATLRADLDRLIPMLDGPDPELQRTLPELQQDLIAHRDTIREVALTSLSFFAKQASESGASVAATLERVSIITGLLIAMLAGLTFVLWRFYLTAQFHSRKAELTGERMTSVVETALDGVIIADMQGIIRDFNQAAETIFGFSRDEIIGRSISETIIPKDARAAHHAGMKRYAETRNGKLVGGGRVTLTGLRKNGEEFPLELSLASSVNNTQEAIIISFVRDVTRRVTAEKELRHVRDKALESERAKDRLLTVMSHEMRTPLNGMLATLELLEETGLTEKQARYVSVIEQSGDVLLSHVNDVLDISRIDSGAQPTDSLRPMDFGTVVRDIVAEQSAIARRNGTRISVSLPPVSTVVGDPAALRRILSNLIGNAIKFTKNGEVDVAVARLGRGDLVEFTISDTGIGIENADRERIFDDFFSLDASYGRSNSGTGLGLGIVKRLVTRLGGEIGVESEPGEGSLFWVRIPLAQRLGTLKKKSVTTAPKPVQAKQQKPQRSLDILVVEDNEINRLVMREMLESAHHKITEANDGIEGVEYALAHTYDLILMDISMPRLDGVEATRRIRNSGCGSCRTPIVAVTANALSHEAEKFRQAGMNETITKPLSRKSIEHALALAGDSVTVFAPPKSSTIVKTGSINLSQLEELNAEIAPEHLAKMFKVFRKDADALVAKLASGPAKAINRAETVADIHKLSGTAAVFGADSFRARLLELQEIGKAGTATEENTRLHELPAIWDRAIREFNSASSFEWVGSSSSGRC